MLRAKAIPNKFWRYRTSSSWQNLDVRAGDHSITASIRLGPASVIDRANTESNDSAVSQRTAAIPNPEAIDTQSKVGSVRARRLRARWPAAPDWVRANSIFKMRYARFAKTTTVTSRFSRTRVQSPCTV